MSVSSEYTNNELALLLSIKGDFDSTQADDFRAAFVDKTPEEFILDMKDVPYIDSTALGSLLELREYAHKQDASVRITQMNDIVLETFRMLNFHKLFKPEYNRRIYRVDWVSYP